MKFNRFAFLLFYSVVSIAYAQKDASLYSKAELEALAAAAQAKPGPVACPTNPNDPYDRGARVTGWGFRYGQCLDISVSRSIEITNLDPAHPKAEPKDGFEVANFSYRPKKDSRFWIARFPELKGSIQDVIFQMERFKPEKYAGHTQLRFVMKPGKELVLRPQGIVTTMEVETLSTFVASVEYLGALRNQKAEPYDLLKGAVGFFGLAYRFVAIEDKVKSMVVSEHHKVEQYRLNLTDEEKEKLLTLAILSSHEMGMTKMYSLATRNCTTEPFHWLDKVVPFDKLVRDSDRGTVRNVNNRGGHSTPIILPVKSYEYLMARRLTSAQNVLPNFEVEFADRLKEFGDEIGK